MTSSQDNLFSIEELFSKISLSRKVTVDDFNLLSLVLESDSLSHEQTRLIERVFYSVRRGWIVLVGIPDEYLCATKARLGKARFSKVPLNN